MKRVSAIDAKTFLGQYLEKVNSEPVTIHKNDRAVAVLISYAEYQRLTALENAYWLVEAEKGRDIWIHWHREVDAVSESRFG